MKDLSELQVVGDSIAFIHKMDLWTLQMFRMARHIIKDRAFLNEKFEESGSPWNIRSYKPL
jgi:hypothetical protein